MAANINTTSSLAKHAHYVHQLLCSPPEVTLLNALAISTKLTTIPGLTPALFVPIFCIPQQPSTHNNQADIVLARAEVDQMCPPHKACMVQDMFCFATVADATLGTMYANITGAFPVWSFKNMQYIFVPLKNKFGILIH
jgi:hypothetical protein